MSATQAFYWLNLTDQEHYCLYEKKYDSEHDPTEGPFCGNCWRSLGTNRMCISFFIILSCLFLVMTLAMGIYLRYRILTSTQDAFQSYYKVFLFILALCAAQIFALTDVFFNFSYDLQAFTLALPAICNFSFISYGISNMIQLNFILVNREPMLKASPSLKRFYWVATFCILTQVANPILMQFEEATDWYPDIPWYEQESNFFYFLRNSLTTLADLSLQFYCYVYLFRLLTELTRIEELSMKRIKVRIGVLGLLIQICLVTYLLLVWLQNLWWYQTGPWLWIVCQSLYISCTVCIPILCFSFLVFEQICSMNKKLSKHKSRYTMLYAEGEHNKYTSDSQLQSPLETSGHNLLERDVQTQEVRGGKRVSKINDSVTKFSFMDQLGKISGYLLLQKDEAGVIYVERVASEEELKKQKPLSQKTSPLGSHSSFNNIFSKRGGSPLGNHSSGNTFSNQASCQTGNHHSSNTAVKPSGSPLANHTSAQPASGGQGSWSTAGKLANQATEEQTNETQDEIKRPVTGSSGLTGITSSQLLMRDQGNLPAFTQVFFLSSRGPAARQRSYSERNYEALDLEDQWNLDQFFAEYCTQTLTVLKVTNESEQVIYAPDGKVFLILTRNAQEDAESLLEETAELQKLDSVTQIGILRNQTLFLTSTVQSQIRESQEERLSSSLLKSQKQQNLNVWPTQTVGTRTHSSRTQNFNEFKQKKWTPGALPQDLNSSIDSESMKFGDTSKTDQSQKQLELDKSQTFDSDQQDQKEQGKLLRTETPQVDLSNASFDRSLLTKSGALSVCEQESANPSRSEAGNL